MCGGTGNWPAKTPSGQGLSPRVRGNLCLAMRASRPAGSIPACAGEPGGAAVTLGDHGVYPRVCGGTHSRQPPSSARGGLSPRVRGNPVLPESSVRPERSIPACAGEPPGRTVLSGTYPVYPRVCGGTHSGPVKHISQRGLSPRVRGNRCVQPQRRPWRRSIPACAGEPLPERRRAHLPEVYPRVCGGTVVVAGLPRPGLGLSPRVRGNLRATEWRELCRGSIPACAGEPSQSQCTSSD